MIGIASLVAGWFVGCLVLARGLRDNDGPTLLAGAALTIVCAAALLAAAFGW